jgi:hypothetical protein
LTRKEIDRLPVWRRGFATRVRGICGRRPQFAAAFLLVLVALHYLRPAPVQADALSEYKVKAAFLFHFAQFVDWPKEAFKDENTPLTYCTLGEDPFQGALDASLRGKLIGARPIQMRHFKLAKEIQGCTVLFLGAAEKKQIPAVLASLSGKAVLTVGETEDFAEDGGMIAFLVEENKIRFEINLEAADKAKLKISSKLLALAKTVIGNQKGN